MTVETQEEAMTKTMMCGVMTTKAKKKVFVLAALMVGTCRIEIEVGENLLLVHHVLASRTQKRRGGRRETNDKRT